jgi:hypothetical protein
MKPKGNSGLPIFCDIKGAKSLFGGRFQAKSAEDARR